MVGRRKKQPSLFDVGNVFDLQLDPQSFHAQLAQVGPSLFPDDAFADLYSPERGRPSVPPSQMALLLLLQYHAGVSDQEAVERSAFDLRWAAVLRRPAGQPLCARTTLLLFRARLALHDATERLFDRALQHARELGLLPEGTLRVILDTKPVMGRGAVEDTYNLLARSMDRLLRALAHAVAQPAEAWAAAHGLSEYVRRREQSLKGGAGIDWADPQARRGFLTEVVAAARRLLATAEALLPALTAEAQAAVQEDLELLRALLAQDVEERTGPGGKPQATLKEGTARDRRPSATDPEQRHGHKSQSRRFDGHKGRVAVEPESQLVVDVEVLAGNAGDAEGALSQIERLEQQRGVTVGSTVGDCAFGAGATRKAFAEAGRELLAKLPGQAERWEIPKRRFTLLWEGETVVGVTCPNGETTREYRAGQDGSRTFFFGACCRRCPLRHKCLQGKGSRSVHIHPQEPLLEEARHLQASKAGRQALRQRVVAEHVLARLARLGIGQARYFGREKTRMQWLFAATVVNLRWMWTWKARQAAA